MNSRQSRRLKAKFLEAFRVTGNITTASSAAGIPHRSIIYDWQENDDQFAVAFREADIIATEVLEAEARRRAVEGVQQVKPIYYQGFQVGQTVVTEYSDRLIEMLLKARAPEKYRERHDITTAGQGLDFSFTILRPDRPADSDAIELPSLADEDDG